MITPSKNPEKTTRDHDHTRKTTPEKTARDHDHTRKTTLKKRRVIMITRALLHVIVGFFSQHPKPRSLRARVRAGIEPNRNRSP